ncbi:uncharacterized protein METZ01_LOCUS186100 [marine metagenome]|uniref:Uncharacterized protein n=1 Tax=marine metagenome TaxID=408172 RepID=A0A382D407_9ZZZZ
MFRYAMETQFRYKFYQDVQFPYLQSLGVDHVFQGFGNAEHGFIGMIHLWWVNEDSGIVYDHPKKGPVAIKGIWRGEWFDTPEQGVLAARQIEKERIYDEQKLVTLTHNYIKQKIEETAQRKAEKLLQERQEIERPAEEDVEEEAKKVILWN